MPHASNCIRLSADSTGVLVIASFRNKSFACACGRGGVSCNCILCASVSDLAPVGIRMFEGFVICSLARPYHAYHPYTLPARNLIHIVTTACDTYARPHRHLSSGTCSSCRTPPTLGCRWVRGPGAGRCARSRFRSGALPSALCAMWCGIDSALSGASSRQRRINISFRKTAVG